MLLLAFGVAPVGTRRERGQHGVYPLLQRVAG
jgi:hypothetical protein